MHIKGLVKKMALGGINKILILYFSFRKRTPKPGPVTIVGMLKAPTGLGAAARLTLETFQRMGFRTTCFDVSKVFVKNFIKTSLPDSLQEGEGGVLLIQNNPIHLPIILFLIGFSKFKNKKIILYAVYELEEIPKSWVHPCKLVDEIWAPSDFAAESYRRSLPEKEVQVVPHFVRAENLERFVKNDKKVKILSLIDINSGFYRKNPIGVLKVFSEINNPNVEFVVKISGHERNKGYYHMILKHSSKIKNLTIIDSKLSDEEKNSLVSSADILVSLHRSEGFGLALAEAMLSGAAILCTGWSAPATFLPAECASYVEYNLIDVQDPQGKYENRGKWADPDLGDAVQKLNRLIEDKYYRDQLSKKALMHSREYFSDKNFEKWVKASEVVQEYSEV